MRAAIIIAMLLAGLLCNAQVMSDDSKANTVDSLWNMSLRPGSSPDADVVLEGGRLKTTEFYNVNTGTQLPLIIYHSADTTGIVPTRRGLFLNDTVNHKLYFSESDKRGGWIILN